MVKIVSTDWLVQTSVQRITEHKFENRLRVLLAEPETNAKRSHSPSCLELSEFLWGAILSALDLSFHILKLTFE